ncbi:MAG: glycosyl hydrolase [Planctomycetota bacterium]
MIRLAIAVLLASGALVSQSSQPLTAEGLQGLSFRSLGPCLTTGRIADLEVSPQDPDVWFLASASGGLFRTKDRGNHWTPIFDGCEGYSLGCVTVDPRDANVVWLGTGENTHNRSASYGTGVYKSLDGGDSWRCVGLRDTQKIQEILIDPRPSAEDGGGAVYVVAPGPLWSSGGERGIYKTTDGGETWRRILHVSDDTGITDAAFRPGNPDVIYAAAYQRRRHNAMCVAGGPEAGILRSVDGGASWQRIENGLPSVDMGRIAIAVDPRVPLRVCATVVARGKAGGTFVSEDGGNSWSKHSNYAGGDPQYYGELFVDPHRASTLWNVDVRVMRSTDLGRTWQPMPFPMHVDNHEIVFDRSDPGHLWIGNDGGLYETYGYDPERPEAARWRHFTNLPLSQFYRVSCDRSRPFYRVTGGAQDNGTIAGPSRSENRTGVRTSDWFKVGGGDGFQSFFDPSRADTVYGQSQNGALYRLDLATGERTGIRPTRDQKERGRWHWDSPLLVSRHAEGRLYYAGERLFRSDDRGDRWRAISGDLTRNLNRQALPIMGKVQDADAVGLHLYTTTMSVLTALDESPLQPDLLYVGSDDGLFHVTEDAGRSWVRVERLGPAPAGSYITDVFASASEKDVVFATVNNWQLGDFRPWVLRSEDRGRSWTDITANLPVRSGAWSIVQDAEADQLLFVGTEFGVYLSVDGGKHWALLDAGMPRMQARDLHIQPQWDDLVVGTFGRGIFVLDDISALRDVTNVSLRANAALFRCRPVPLYKERREVPAVWGDERSPNPPFGAVFTYHVGAGLDSGRLVLTIRNETGEPVRTLGLDRQPGFHRVTWALRSDGAQIVEGEYTATLGLVAGAGSKGAAPIALDAARSFHVVPLER